MANTTECPISLANIEQIAAEIVALINATPRTPAAADIAATIGKAGIGGGEDALFHHRVAWRALCDKYDAAEKIAHLSEENELLECDALIAMEDFAEEHLVGDTAPQARTLRDIFLLAEAVFKMRWPEYDLIDGGAPAELEEFSGQGRARAGAVAACNLGGREAGRRNQ